MPGIRASDLEFDRLEEGEACFWVEARSLAEFCNPLETPPWEGVDGPITAEEVYRAIEDGNVVKDHVGPGDKLPAAEDMESRANRAVTRGRHVGRIAAFVAEMPDDPITIDVGMPSFGFGFDGNIRIEDGHHRLAAAIILGRPILTTFSGEWAEFQALFPESIYAAPGASPSRVAGP